MQEMSWVWEIGWKGWLGGIGWIGWIEWLIPTFDRYTPRPEYFLHKNDIFAKNCKSLNMTFYAFRVSKYNKDSFLVISFIKKDSCKNLIEKYIKW